MVASNLNQASNLPNMKSDMQMPCSLFPVSHSPTKAWSEKPGMIHSRAIPMAEAALMN